MAASTRLGQASLRQAPPIPRGTAPDSPTPRQGTPQPATPFSHRILSLLPMGLREDDTLSDGDGADVPGGDGGPMS